MAKQAKTILQGALQLAVMANAARGEPRSRRVWDQTGPAAWRCGADGPGARELLARLRASEYCRKHDLIDPITVLIATGARRSELVGLRWSDFDIAAGTIAVTGKMVRVAGKGLARVDETKTGAGKRTIPLQTVAIDTLTARRKLPYVGEQKMIFTSAAGTWRDPDNFNRLWRRVRNDLGVPEATTHSFPQGRSQIDR